ncbi:MAG: GatB/YqeY domain-containing protein [bacterium]|nr:GatB/YqeY domain-containing protein [bacterium]
MLKEKLQEDLKAAMKAGDAEKRDVLRMLSSAIKNKEIDKRIELTDEQALDVIASEVKKRKESVVQFTAGNRPELATKEEAEIKILAIYLPEQLGEEELKKIVTETLAGMDKSDVGGAMKAVMAKVKGKADGALVSKLVKDAIG